METAMATATWWDRLGWALGGSVRALVSLPLVETAWERSIGALLALLALVWAAIGARDARTRRGWRSVLPWTLWGLGWFLAAAATLTTVFPYWMPNRSGFGSIGLVAAAAELAGAVHPLLIGGLVAVRIAALALAPAPPAMISVAAPQTGAFLDFEQLVRLQRLMLETRQALAPRLAGVHSPRVAELRMPVQARYAFGGSNALRTWSRDPEAEAIPTQELRADAPDPRLTAVAEFEPNTTPQVVVVEPGAMYAYLEGYARVDAGDHARGLELLARADSLQRNRGAQSFLGTVAGERSFALLALGRDAEAEREAKLGAQLFAFNVTARAVLGQLALERGDLQTAAAHADSILRWRRDDPVGLNLRAQILRAAREAPK
jgi:hypothetical protein